MTTAASRGKRIALVTGGARGIGGAFAVPLDVADPAGPRRAIEDILAREGQLDVLVKNAGGPK